MLIIVMSIAIIPNVYSTYTDCITAVNAVNINQKVQVIVGRRIIRMKGELTSRRGVYTGWIVRAFSSCW